MASFVNLGYLKWKILTDLSEPPIGSIFKALDAFSRLDFEDGTDMLSRDVGKQLLLYAA